MTAAPSQVPEPLVKQLKLGGRMVIPVGPEIRALGSAEDLFLLRKTDHGLEREALLPVRFVPMTGEAGKPTRTPR